MANKEKYIVLFGKIVMNFAALEKALKKTLYHVSDMEVETANLVTARLSFTNVLFLFQDFVINKYQKDKVIISESKKLVKLLIDANSARNEIIHSYWLEHPLDDILFKEKMRKNKKVGTFRELIEYKPEELNKVLKKIDEADKALLSFMRQSLQVTFF